MHQSFHVKLISGCIKQFRPSAIIKSNFCPEHNNSSGVGGVKVAEAFPEGRGSPHGCGLRARLTGHYLAPDPVAEGDKLKVPRSGDFVRQSPGAGVAAIGRPAPFNLYGEAH